MKKLLYCAAVVALATACTNEDDFAVNPSSQAQGQGLTFNVSLAGNNVQTKGELYEQDGVYPFFWYAEQDRINVLGLNLQAATTTNVGYGDNKTDGSGQVEKGIATQSGGVWSGLTHPAVYKATQSKGEGQFTAASDADMLAFDGAETATIVATYGDIKATAIASKMNTGNTDIVPGMEGIIALTVQTTASNSTQNVKRANQVIAPMYSVSSAVSEEPYHSVGEKANLSLIRPFPVLRFTTQNVSKYAEDFGPLKSVKLTTIGKTGEKWDAAKEGSAIAYDASKEYTIVGTTTGFETGYEAASAPNVVTVNISGTDKWSDNDAVYMTVAPVNRKADKTEDLLKVEYQFENITFTLDGTKENAKPFEVLTSSNDWTSVSADGRPNAVTIITPLDINNYDYLVVGSGTDYSLIINRGTVASTLTADGTKVVWPAGTGDAVVASQYAVANIKKVYVNCAIEDADFANLNKFTSATLLEMPVQTSIPADGLEKLTGVKELILPEVTDIDEEFVSSNFTNLTRLEMGSYDFEGMEINDRFFNEGTDGKLKYIDVEAVTDFGPVYLGRTALIFQNYTALDSIKVADGANLYPNQFNGCENLVKVIGRVNLSANKATYAFQNAKKLETINVTTTIVPDYAFYNAEKIENVLVDGKQIIPTEVGVRAFQSAKALEYMDLSKLTALGERAFNSSSLKGAKTGADLKVGAATISDGAFQYTKVEYVHFTKATAIGDAILKGVTTLKQIKFNEKFGLRSGLESTRVDAETFGDATNLKNVVDLLVNKDQAFDGAKLTLGTGNFAQDFTFKAIRVEAPKN